MGERVETVEEIIKRGVEPKDLLNAIDSAIEKAKANVERKNRAMKINFDGELDKWLDDQDAMPTEATGHCDECEDFYFDDECEGCKARDVLAMASDNVIERLKVSLTNNKRR